VSGMEVRDGRGGNWYWLHNAVIDRFGAQLGAYGIAVYACLCRHAGQDQRTWLSQGTIAEQIGASRQQVNRMVARLQSLRLVAVEERADATTGRLTNLYTLLALPPDGGGRGGDLSTTGTPLSTTATGGVNGGDSPLSTTATAMMNKTQLTRLHEQEGAARARAADARATAPIPANKTPADDAGPATTEEPTLSVEAAPTEREHGAPGKQAARSRGKLGDVVAAIGETGPPPAVHAGKDGAAVAACSAPAAEIAAAYGALRRGEWGSPWLRAHPYLWAVCQDLAEYREGATLARASPGRRGYSADQLRAMARGEAV
jgi:hypothetical protein